MNAGNVLNHTLFWGFITTVVVHPSLIMMLNLNQCELPSVTVFAAPALLYVIVVALIIKAASIWDMKDEGNKSSTGDT